MRQGNVAAGPDESTIVQLDEAAEPSFQAGLAVAVGNPGAEPCARLGADRYEGGRGGMS
jgi:hypothetical protein